MIAQTIMKITFIGVEELEEPATKDLLTLSLPQISKGLQAILSKQWNYQKLQFQLNCKLFGTNIKPNLPRYLNVNIVFSSFHFKFTAIV